MRTIFDTNSYRLWVLVGVSGVIGALSRWIISLVFEQFLFFPSHATLFLVNASGCVLMGIIVEWGSLLVESTYNQLNYIASGFVGSYTTFSAVMADTFNLILGVNPYLPVILLFAHTLIGYASFRLSRAFVKTTRMVFSRKGMSQRFLTLSFGRTDSSD